MSIDDAIGGLFPPHELRGLLATVADRGDAQTAAVPSSAATTPGLAGAVLAPGHAVPEADPNSMAFVLSRVAGELLGPNAATIAGLSPISKPNLESLPGLAPMIPPTPGISPQLIAMDPGGSISAPPVVPEGTNLPSPDVAGIPAAPAPPVLMPPFGDGSWSGTVPELSSPELTALSSMEDNGFGAGWIPPTAPATTTSVPVRDAPATPGVAADLALPAELFAPVPLPVMPAEATVPAGAVPADPTTPTVHPADAATYKPSTQGIPGVANAGNVASAYVPPTPEITVWPVEHASTIPVQDLLAGVPPPAGGLGSFGSPPGFATVPAFATDAASLEPDLPLYWLPAGLGTMVVPATPEPPSSTAPTPSVAGDPGSWPRVESGGLRPQDGDGAPGSGSTIRESGGVAFDPYRVRRDFPILSERVHGGKPLVWLDNGATTQKPRAVIDRLTYYYEHENSNVHRAAHTLAARATDAFESARETTRKFLNATSPSEIVFVRGATEGINLIANTWGRRNIERGDEIILTHLEHHANIVPWQQLCAETGARLRVAPVDDRGDVLLDEYERLFCSRTKLVAFTQVSNALGTITPAREMIEVAHHHGATVMLDGAQAVSHMQVDVQQLDCDFYVFSGHKVFAPTGIGAVYGKRAILDRMPPWQGGGNMIADVTFEKTVYQPPPGRFEAGTGNIADAAGMGAALDYVMRIGLDAIDRYEHELLLYATDRLREVPGLRMIGTSARKAGVLSFVLAGQKTEDVGAILDKDGIAVRSGHHCAQPILRRFGVEATVRASLAFYNVREDIDALVDALHRLQRA